LSRATWSPRQRRKNDVIFAVARRAVALGLALPKSWLAPLGTLLGSIAHAALRDERATARRNVARVRPELGPAERDAFVRATFRALGRNLTDTLALLDPTEAPDRTLGITRESRDVLDAALAEGRGVVYATCHLGPWERMAALLAGFGYPITTLARESYDERFQVLIYERLRSHRNIETIHRGSPSAPVAIVRALRRGRVLGFLVDLAGRAARSHPVTWLGQPSRVVLGPARLALRTGAPIVVGTPAGSPTGLFVRIARLSTADLPEGDEGEAVLCQRIADALSERIFALPEQWPWMHPSFAWAESPDTPGFLADSGRSAAHFRLVQSRRGLLH
jgi:KDO2-lipid IV(A) lauroyltransferase